MKITTKIFLMFSIAALMYGCAGSKFSFDEARRVKIGMTTSDVQSIMGRPYRVTARDGKEIWIWSYANGLTGAHQSISFVFTNGIVESVPTIPASFD